jgi:hypothetical protein
LIERLQRYLRGLCDEAVPPEDAVLLHRSVTARDREACALLIARRGPMVLGTARRLVGNTHGAEGAFQATFLASPGGRDLPTATPEGKTLQAVGRLVLLLRGGQARRQPACPVSRRAGSHSEMKRAFSAGTIREPYCSA